MVTTVKKIGNKGEIVIPKEIREEIGLEPNNKVEIVSTKDRIVIIPLVKDVRELAGLFGRKKIKDMGELDRTIDELMAGIEE